MTDDLHHLAAAYALDALDDQQRAEFEQHYPTCEICSAEVAEFREVAASLASAEAAEPPAALRDRVLDEIARTPQRPPELDEGPIGSVVQMNRRLSRTGRLALAAAAVALLLVGILGTLLVTDRESTTDDIVSAPDAVVTTMASVDDGGVIQVVWSADRDEVAVIGSELEPAGAGLAYALWFVLGDEVAPAALFTPDTDGDVTALLRVDDLDADGWGITIEPAGGSPQPTTPIIFSGSV